MGKFKDMDINDQQCCRSKTDVIKFQDQYPMDVLAKEIFENNKAKGFWDAAKTVVSHIDDSGRSVDEYDFVPELRNTGELLMLIVSEVAEAMEAHRKDKMDDHLPQYKGLHVEVADALIRILDFAGAHQIPIGKIVQEKIAYNKTRPYKHGKKF